MEGSLNQRTEVPSKGKHLSTHHKGTLGVFERFTTDLPDGSVNTSKFLSKECYQTWLNTRTTYPKDAAHAFRKVVTGHCRGDHGLQPFPKEVEQSLLKLLRNKTVWPCFKGTKHKIGSRGFQTLGYWERKAGNVIISKKKRRRSEQTALSITGSQISTESFSNFYDQFIKNEDELALQQLQKKLEAERDLLSSSCVFKSFIKTFNKYISTDLSLLLSQIQKQTGFSIFENFGDFEPQSFFPRDLSDFVFVEENEKRFPRNRYVGHLVLDALSLSVIDQDEAAKDIFHGSVMSMTLTTLLYQKVEALPYFEVLLRELNDKGVAWFRSVVFRCDGTKMILLQKCEILFQNCFTVSIYDETKKFKKQKK